MKLKKILQGVKVLNARQIKNVTIKNVSNKTCDNLEQGLYVCLKGEKVDGHNLKQEALKRGAVAFLVEEYDYDFSGLQILVEDTREALSIVAKNFYAPKTPKIIGITGTNGKTTTTNIVSHILKCAGKKVGLIGTEGVFFNEQKIVLHMTTPDPIELFKLLGQMYNDSIEYVVMEVSAHSIYLKKIYALDFFVRALTNITEDHLDFFKTLKNYQQTKMQFISNFKGIKIVNIDDKYGCKIAGKNGDVFTYSTRFPADAMATNISCQGRFFDAVLNGKLLKVKCKLIGNYNVQNILCAMLICNKIGINDEQILSALQTFMPVEGRLNVYKKENKTAVIDFAHTPDAMNNVLSVLKKETQGKLFCVFGCGGNREQEKRPIMGEIASSICDFCVITDDNPRFEDSRLIANQVASGIKGNNFKIIQNRSEAIAYAVSLMQDGDLLAICGKGAEDYLEIKGQKLPYSDKEELLKLGFLQN